MDDSSADSPKTREEKWLADAKAGDRDAFNQLCSSVLPDLYELARCNLCQKEDAADLTQAVMAQLVKHLQSIESFREYAFKVMWNSLNDRGRRRRSEVGSHGRNHYERATASDGLLEVLIHDETVLDLDAAVGMLDQAEYDVIQMHFYSNLTLVAISDLLGRPYDSVRYIKDKAITRLRAMIDKRNRP